MKTDENTNEIFFWLSGWKESNRNGGNEMANIHRILADDCECHACVSWCCLWSARAVYIYKKRVNIFLSHHFSSRKE